MGKEGGEMRVRCSHADFCSVTLCSHKAVHTKGESCKGECRLSKDGVKGVCIPALHEMGAGNYGSRVER